MVKRILIATGVLLLLLIVLTFRPVSVKRANCLQSIGVVDMVYEGGVHDIVIHLKDDNQRYYINRGLEKDLTISGLQEKLIGKEVNLCHLKHWSLLKPRANTSGHISELRCESELIYSEFLSN